MPLSVFSLSIGVLFLLSMWSKDLYNIFNKKIYQKKGSSISTIDKQAKSWHRCNPWLSIKSTQSFKQIFLQGQMSQLLLGPTGAQGWQLPKELSKNTLQHHLYSKLRCKYSSKPPLFFCPSWNHFIFDDLRLCIKIECHILQILTRPRDLKCMISLPSNMSLGVCQNKILFY